MWIAALIPFALQLIFIGFDEIYFHHKRGLPKWERIGHPLDTLSFLACLAMAAYLPFTDDNLKIFIALTILSCVLVTKDEFVHKEKCTAHENWVHAILFILHPITLTLTGFLWPISQGFGVPGWLPADMDQPEFFAFFLYMQTFSVFLFFLYQVIFWNLLWEPKRDQQ